MLRESVGLTLALQDFGATYFSNGTKLSGVFLSPRAMGPKEKADNITELRKFHEGRENAHRFALLEGGMSYQQLGVPPEDSQFLESRKFQRAELCGVFGVPPHLIADLERATFSNVENESLRWLRDGLEPYLVNWESAIRRDLLGPRAFDSYYPRFIRNAMVRGDLKSLADALAIMRQNGVISANEWRALEELDPISAADAGDKYIISSQSRPSEGVTPTL